MPNPTPRPHSDRLRFAAVPLAALLLAGAVLRVVLYAAFHEGSFDVLALAGALLAGSLFDLLCGLVVLLPAGLLLATFRLRVLRRPGARFAVLACCFAALLFDATAQVLFFDEFNARYNHIALDYLIYPTEVFGNIAESYPVAWIVAGALGGGALAAWLVVRRQRPFEFGPLPLRARALGASSVLALAGVAGAAMFVLPAEISTNRITSEIAQNGQAQLVRAFVTAELDYEAYYETLPRAAARARAAHVLGFDAPSAEQCTTAPEAFELQRELVPPRERSGTDRLDVVVVMEESFGSNFVGVLGNESKHLTPNLDRWSRDGLLLTNLVANGNRTVRGLEGVLCSFPPLPGDSVVKRSKSQDVATLARVFGAQGYATCFLYGGYGVFDHMKPFMTTNGWNEFVEQPDYPDGAFRTAWGVADEYIFDALLARQERAHASGERLFATVMSVSNHRPYDVPPGRVDLPSSRFAGVKYADWALGRWLDAARERGLLEHTLVLVVGDHGARVYGQQEIPVASYRIPALFLAPDPAWRGRRIERLCSQIDLAPTLLALAGVRCTAPFFGRELLSQPDGRGRAFVHHNNDVGLLTDDALVVLGLNRKTTFYRRTDRASDVFEPTEATPELRALEQDAAAVFQTAYELYGHGRFALPHVPRVALR